MEDPLKIEHIEEDKGGAFVIKSEDGTRWLAEMTYRREAPDVVAILHTGVRDELQGRGVAGQLVKAGVEWARAAKVRVVPVCSYAAAAFQRHPEWSDLLEKS